MKYLIKKLIKGLVALKLSCLLFLSFLLILQSCSDDYNIAIPETIPSHLIEYNQLLTSQKTSILHFVDEISKSSNQKDSVLNKERNFTEKEAEQLLDPLLEGSKYFLRNIGLSDLDIEYIIDDGDEYKLIPMVMILYELELDMLNNKDKSRFVSFNNFLVPTIQA